jgi:voltage-gated potassium channel
VSILLTSRSPVVVRATKWEVFYKIFEDPFFFSDYNPQGLHSVPFRYLSLLTTQTINLLIVVATGALCMESMPEYNPKRPGKEDWKDVWDNFEVFCVVMFSLDFFARILGSVMCGRVRDFTGDVLNYIDLFAILPFYVEIFVGGMVDLRFVRVIRLVRILRTLRNPRFGNMGGVVANIVTESAGALLVPLFFMILSLVLFSCIIFTMEKSAPCDPENPLDNSTCPTFTHIPETMYWCATTLTTVGYGDFSPATMPGRLATFAVMLSGIFFLAMPLTIVGGAFNDEWGKIESATQKIDARDIQKEDRWRLEPGQIEHLTDDLRGHIRRMQQHLEECERIAPDGEHWSDLEEKLKLVAVAFDRCKGLYPDLDDGPLEGLSAAGGGELPTE